MRYLADQNSCSTQKLQGNTSNSIDHLTDELRGLSLELKAQISALYARVDHSTVEDFRQQLRSATALASSISYNRHFNIPQNVSSYYTGREKILVELRRAFHEETASQTQKRFIVYGLGGAGKSQFVSKFAQDNREDYWGVFWVDASSEESAKHTFRSIAKVADVDPNERAVKYWLSHLDYPWLLIIDSADDPNVLIEDFFPDGQRGHIIVTTRNPSHRVHGTAGSRFCHFEGLEEVAAKTLLLISADQPNPWTADIYSLAACIAKALGHLPLALVHAGKAILNGMCTLSCYLGCYERKWERLRGARRSLSNQKDDENLNVFSSYEIIYAGLEHDGTNESSDAIVLLKLFSFLHCEHIRLDILISAALNPCKEEESHNSTETTETRPNTSGQTWGEQVKRFLTRAINAYQESVNSPVLPHVIRNNTGGGFDDLRLRSALHKLSQVSLINHRLTAGEEAYSMHPLVHQWVRERPQMTTAEQAFWCQAAATTLAQSILLEPLGFSEHDEDLRRDILPHIDHVRRLRREIRARINLNVRNRRITLLNHDVGYDLSMARQCFKFSRVYNQCGRWKEAEKLQIAARRFFVQKWGPEHDLSIKISLALSQNYVQQSRYAEAVDLQKQLLEICERCRGCEDRQTLKVTSILGKSFNYQRRYKEALVPLTTAVQGLSRTLGRTHEESLTAIDNLARVYRRLWQYDKAKMLSAEAYAGMSEVLGPSHLKTLIAQENLAMAYLAMGKSHLLTAKDHFLQVLHLRIKKLGKEAPLTLLTFRNLAWVKAELGELDESENELRHYLPIAERNLSPDHSKVLGARMYLARVLSRQNKYQEAEEILLDVIHRQKYQQSARNGENPDRMFAMSLLVQCYQAQNRVDEALEMSDQIEKALDVLNYQDHPFATAVKKTSAELRASQGASTDFAPRAIQDSRDRVPSMRASG